MNKSFRFAHRKGRAIQVMFQDENRWISTGCYTMQEAEAWAEAHLYSSKKDLTLREYAEGFYTKADPRRHRERNSKLGREYKDNYYAQRQAMLDKYILAYHGAFLMKNITPRMIEALLFDTERANDTRNKIMAVYRTVLQTAKDDLLIPTNPAADLKMFSARSKKRDVFTTKEIHLLFPDTNEELFNIWEEWWAVYFMTLHETGWRPSELESLRVENIFPEKLAIYTSTSIGYDRKPQQRIKTSEHGFDYKIGFVSERAMKLLLAHKDEDGYLFRKDGIFPYPNVCNRQLRLACDHCGIPYKSQYCFRHTFDSEMFGNIPDEYRKMLMGHSGKSNYDYLHLKPEEAIERAEKLKKL